MAKDIGTLGMTGIQIGAKAVDGLVDLGVNSLNEAIWGDYYRDKEVVQLQEVVQADKQQQAEQVNNNYYMIKQHQ